MGLKILHSADWHMDAPFQSFEGERRDVLRRAQLAIPGRVAELCRREHCDLVLLAGDIFDGKPSREAVEAVWQGLAECAVPVFVSPGNHDFCGMGSAWLEEAWPENVTVFTGELEEISLPELNCRIWGAGYRAMDCGALLEGFRAEAGEGDTIGLLHGDPVTTRSPYCSITKAQIRASGLTYLALGHIHKAGQLRAGETLCAWPGCPMGRGWDETGEKGVYLVTLGDPLSLEFRSLGLPCFYDEEVDATDGFAALEAQLPAAGSRDFYRITLTGEEGEPLPEALEQRYPNLILRDRRQPKPDLWEDVDSDTFRGAYFRLLKEQTLENPRACLAAEISKKILAGREVKLP